MPEDTPIWLLELLKSMIHYSPSKRYPIGTILEICRSSLKCIDILGKCIKVGKKNLPLRKISTEINPDIDGWPYYIYIDYFIKNHYLTNPSGFGIKIRLASLKIEMMFGLTFDSSLEIYNRCSIFARTWST